MPDDETNLKAKTVMRAGTAWLDDRLLNVIRRTSAVSRFASKESV